MAKRREFRVAKPIGNRHSRQKKKQNNLKDTQHPLDSSSQQSNGLIDEVVSYTDATVGQHLSSSLKWEPKSFNQVDFTNQDGNENLIGDIAVVNQGLDCDDNAVWPYWEANGSAVDIGLVRQDPEHNARKEPAFKNVVSSASAINESPVVNTLEAYPQPLAQLHWIHQAQVQCMWNDLCYKYFLKYCLNGDQLTEESIPVMLRELREFQNWAQQIMEVNMSEQAVATCDCNNYDNDLYENINYGINNYDRLSLEDMAINKRPAHDYNMGTGPDGATLHEADIYVDKENGVRNKSKPKTSGLESDKTVSHVTSTSPPLDNLHGDLSSIDPRLLDLPLPTSVSQRSPQSFSVNLETKTEQNVKNVRFDSPENSSTSWHDILSYTSGLLSSWVPCADTLSLGSELYKPHLASNFESNLQSPAKSRKSIRKPTSKLVHPEADVSTRVDNQNRAKLAVFGAAESMPKPKYIKESYGENCGFFRLNLRPSKD